MQDSKAEAMWCAAAGAPGVGSCRSTYGKLSRQGRFGSIYPALALACPRECPGSGLELGRAAAMSVSALTACITARLFLRLPVAGPFRVILSRRYVRAARRLTKY